MATQNGFQNLQTMDTNNYNTRKKELESFENTKLGVKGLLDAGITSIPRIFHHPPETLFDHEPTQKLDQNNHDSVNIPIVDLSCDYEEELVDQLRDATAKYGFFQVINHGVPVSLLDRSVDAIKAFHELKPEDKMHLYSRDHMNNYKGTGVGYHSNHDLFHSNAASWRDTLAINIAPIAIDPTAIPEICRAEVIEWDKEVKQLGERLMRLLAQGLGLSADKLTGESYLGRRLICGHYYPYCPEPKKTVGTTSHTDPGILTVLLQNQLGGLQVKFDGEWVDVKLIHGALIVNIGDLFQIISNDEYTSGEHRVYANPSHEPRVSVATFFSPGDYENMYRPLPELVSPERPAVYQQLKCSDLIKNFYSRKLEGKSMVSYFRL